MNKWTVAPGLSTYETETCQVSIHSQSSQEFFLRTLKLSITHDLAEWPLSAISIKSRLWPINLCFTIGMAKRGHSARSWVIYFLTIFPHVCGIHKNVFLNIAIYVKYNHVSKQTKKRKWEMAFPSSQFIHSFISFIPQASYVQGTVYIANVWGRNKEPQPHRLMALCLRILFLLSSNLLHCAHLFINLNNLFI